MYLKVATLIVGAVFISGCSMFNKPKPKNPNVIVVEEIDMTKEASSAIEEPGGVIDDTSAKSKAESKYHLKPEPFSLESNENDPELLGPQSTVKTKLLKQEESGGDINTTNENKKESL